MDSAKHPEPLLDIENVLPVLNKISIFAGFSDKQLYAIFRELERVSYDDGALIFEQGSEPSHIYIIQQGMVKLMVGDENTSLELIELMVGACFGETAVIGILPHAASAVAVGKTELVVLSRHALLALYKTDLELYSLLILNIAREACRRLYQTDRILLHYVLDGK
jgi:CRP/FNR family cyclic AMP-dependent transcriptional regulator